MADQDREQSLVDALERECKRLREELAKTRAERDVYIKAIYSDPLGMKLMANLDISDFETISAGPMELLDEPQPPNRVC